MWQNRRKKSIFPDLLFSKFFLIFCVVIFLVVLFYLAQGTIKTYKVNSEITDLQNDINRLEKQNQDLGQLISYLKSDAFIEQEAKLKLGLKKPGENLVVIPQVNETKIDNSEVTNKELTNPAKWWVYFFKKYEI
jgi:cell division protein FtsL